MVLTQSCTQKKSATPFFAGLNNLLTILTRIVSQFWFSIKNQILKSADQLASFSKYVIKLWLLFGQLLLDLNDSQDILMRIVLQIWTYFRTQNWTIVARTATVLGCVIEFPRQTEKGRMTHCVFSLGGGAFFHFLLYYGKSKSTLKAAMSYMTYNRWIAWKKSKMQ
jgi:hypothetical protein